MPILRHIFLGILVCWFNLRISATQLQNADNPSNGSLSDQPKRLYQPGGRRVYLYCDGQAKSSRRRFSKHSIVWHYKLCGSWANTSLCSETATADWSEMNCGKKGCKSVLDLGLATREENGLYRCSIKNKTPNLKTLATYELYIDDNAMDLDFAPYWDNAPDYPSMPPLKPVQIFRPGGRAVELQCKDKVEPSGNRKVKPHGIMWHYKKCGNRYGISPCIDFSDDLDLSDWLLVTCRGKDCRNTTLDLGKPTEDDNGLYRCSIRNKQLSRVVIQYELEIVDKANSSAEFLGDSPLNLTVHVGQSAPFQCRVLSKVKPTILWLRRREPNSVVHNHNFIEHLNETYEQMVSHPPIAFTLHEYLSKLVLPKVGESDSGFYVCLAINNVDVSYRQAYLTVLPKYYYNYAATTDTAGPSLHWLFLIPAGLALVPVSVWLCCLWRRNKRRATAASVVASQSQASCNNNGPRKTSAGFKYEPVSETTRAKTNVQTNVQQAT